jgi:hypothetical protein
MFSGRKSGVFEDWQKRGILRPLRSFIHQAQPQSDGQFCSAEQQMKLFLIRLLGSFLITLRVDI